MPGQDKLITFQGENGNLAKSPYEFRPRGECGKMTSDLLPHLGALARRLVLHALADEPRRNTHGPGENFMSTGFTLDGFPSMGAWMTYALGSENEDLPAFVAIPDPRGVPQASVNNWGPGFLPAVFQGTAFNAQQPIRHLAAAGDYRRRDGEPPPRDFLKRLNDAHLAKTPRRHRTGGADRQLRIGRADAAQRAGSDRSVAASRSTSCSSYGADDAQNPIKAGFAGNCILARRLIERGVRFVQLFNGAYAMGEGVGNWDGHKQAERAIRHPRPDPRPAGGRAADATCKQRGLLEDTLVVWCTEFGRMPTFQKGATGRDHNPAGFTCWLAGAGVKAPFSYGATDEFGYQAVENVTTVHDFHATILHLLGLDHERLSVLPQRHRTPPDRRARPRHRRSAGLKATLARSASEGTGAARRRIANLARPPRGRFPRWRFGLVWSANVQPCASNRLLSAFGKRRQFEFAEVDFGAFGLQADRTLGLADRRGAVHQFAVHFDFDFIAPANDLHRVPFADRLLGAVGQIEVAATLLTFRFVGYVEFGSNHPKVAGVFVSQLYFDRLGPHAERGRLGRMHEHPVVAPFAAGFPTPFDHQAVVFVFALGSQVAGRIAPANEYAVGDGPHLFPVDVRIGEHVGPAGQVLAVEQRDRLRSIRRPMPARVARTQRRAKAVETQTSFPVSR